MFSYDNLLKEIQQFCNYGVEVGTVGESELHQRIPYVFVGKKTGYNMIVQGAMHGREHLTALVVTCLAKHLVKNSNLPIYGGIYFVPMTNPDGVRLCQEGTSWITDKNTRDNLLRLNGGSDDFSLWKANAKGVDINVNFDANWSKGNQNVFEPSSANFVGESAFCTTESRALADFTQLLNPCVTLSYHLKGEEVYWDFAQKSHRRWRDFRYATAICNYTGYKLVDDKGSAGGYKDWCVEKLKIPAFTIEVGNDKFDHPFPYHQLQTILNQNLDLPRKLLNTIVKHLQEWKNSNLLHLFD